MEKIALLFPGQGAQYAGMGESLCSEFDIAAQTFEQANDVLGFDLKKICFKGRLGELTRMEYLFPALLTFGTAVFRVYRETIGITPHFSAGHSIGEYTALVCSGVINFQDALDIVYQRGILAQEILDNNRGSMTVINDVNKKYIEDECRKVSSGDRFAVVSCYNSPHQVVISGHRETVMKVEDAVIKSRTSSNEFAGVQVTPLLMSPPFHCRLMEPTAKKLEAILEKYSYSAPSWPVISNLYARPYQAPADVIDNLTRQLTHPVKWEQTMIYLRDQGTTVMIDMGPQAVMSNLAGMNAAPVHCISFGREDDRKQVLQNFRTTGKLRDTHTLFTVPAGCLSAAVCTRNHNWDNDEYQKGVVAPYERIQEIQDQLEENGGLPSREQMLEALELLEKIFITKKVPAAEQVKRFNRIFAETGTEYLFQGDKGFKIPTA